MFDEVFDINKLPTLDLHGEIADFARIRINEFIEDNIKMKNKYIAIIHGKGTGIIKKTTIETLKGNKKVEDYKLCYFNDGMTLVKLRR